MSKHQSILSNGDGDQPVTQAEFTRTMTALKADLDQVATKADLEQLATKAELKEVKADVQGLKADVHNLKSDISSVKQTTEQILELIEGIDQKMKPLRDLPERMERVERAVFP